MINLKRKFHNYRAYTVLLGTYNKRISYHTRDKLYDMLVEAINKEVYHVSADRPLLDIIQEALGD